MTDEEEGNYELVMPFVCCATNGGIYDDAAFVAGIKFGDALERLNRDGYYHGYVPPDLIPQMDLLAMHKGLPIESQPWDEAPDEHVYVVIGTVPGDER